MSFGKGIDKLSTIPKVQIESNDIECQLTEFIRIPFISPSISQDSVCSKIIFFVRCVCIILKCVNYYAPANLLHVF